MIGKEMISEKPADISTVKDLLSKRKKDSEFTFEQKVTYEYVDEFAPKKSAAAKAMEKLKEEGVDDKMAVKLMDAMPANATEVKLIFEKVRFTLSDEKISKILDALSGLK